MNKIVMYGLGIATVATAGLATMPNLASAQSGVSNGQGNGNGNGYGYQQMLQTKADLLGMTEDELTTQLQTKTMDQIAEEKGISEDKLHEAMQSSAEKRWAARGLTQAEIDSRLQEMKERQASGDHTGNSASRGNGMGRGMHVSEE
jgi:hypothetical protein